LLLTTVNTVICHCGSDISMLKDDKCESTVEDVALEADSEKLDCKSHSMVTWTKITSYYYVRMIKEENWWCQCYIHINMLR